MGLLASAEANLFKKTKGLAFSVLTKKYNLTRFALFSLSNENYFITDSTGFDASSLIKSFSTKAFWDGTLPELNKVYHFEKSDNSISILLQFFSENLQEVLTSVDILKTSQSIFVLINDKISDSLKDDLANLKLEEDNSNFKEVPGLFISVNFQEAIESYVESSTIIKDFSEQLKKSLFKLLSNQIIKMIDSDNYYLDSDSYILQIVSSQKNISENLLIFHIVTNLKEIIENSAEIIDISVEQL